MDPTSIPPEVMAAYMQQLTQEEQDADLQHQMALAEQMMQPGPERYGALGAGIQALADVVRTVRGKQKLGDLRGQRGALGQRRQAGRETVGNHWLQQFQQPAEQPIPDAVQAPEDFSMQPPALLRRPAGG